MTKKYTFFIVLLLLPFSNMIMAKPNDSLQEIVVKKDVRKAFVGKFYDALENMFYPEGGKYEIGYTYSSVAPANTYFPLGIYGEWAGEWAEGWVALSTEIAFNLSNNTYPLPGKEYVTYAPTLYWLLGLGWNCNVFSINFSAGIVGSSRLTRIDFLDKTISSNKVNFFLQPSIHVHIPVDDFEHFISLKVGYNICPSLRDFNGLNIGIGFGGWY